MPLVTIKILEGRTRAQKRKMVKDVTNAIVNSIGCPVDAVHLNIVEMKPENVGDGGRLFCDTHK
jgi:4-oxalocrotonate tautomerase